MPTDSGNSSSSDSTGNTLSNSSVPASLCDEPINAAKDDSLAAAASNSTDAKDTIEASSVQTQDPSSNKSGTSDLEPAKPPLVLPDWFLANNITLFDDMPEASPGVRFLRSDDDEGKETPLRDEKDKSMADESGGIVDYELQQDVYDEILDLASLVVQPPPSSAPKLATAAWAEAAAVILQSPRKGSLRFLEHIARRIALDLHADLVSFDYDDVASLSVDFWDAEADGERWKSEEMKLAETVFCSGRREEVSTAAFEAILGGAQRKLAGAHVDRKKDVVLGGTNEEEVLPDTTLDKSPQSEAVAGEKEHQAPTSDLADAAIHKPGGGKPQVIGDETQGQNRAALGQMEETQGKDEGAPGKKEQHKVARPAERPLVVFVHEASAMPDEKLFCRRLRKAVVAQREAGRSIFILATEISPRKWSATPRHVKNVWGGLGIKESTSFNLTPRHTKRASEALKSHEKESNMVNNWRWICRTIRCALLDAGQDAVAQGLFPETLKRGEKHRLPDQLSEDARETLTKWKKKEITSVVRQVCARARRPDLPPLEAKDVYAIMARTQRNIKLLKASRKADEPFEDEPIEGEPSADEPSEDEGGAGKKEEKKSKVQELLDKISGDCNKSEKQLMSCVVDIDATAAAADGIRIDPETMAGLDQMLSLRVRKSYGLLAKEGINGGVLFGPPGTGKTHLARVVAAKSGMNLVVATPADVQSCWVGQTEGRIQALFSLGRKLSPCIIFIDEAESLLARRGAGDRGYTRKAMSQFLSEMDGLVQGDRKEKAPFLLIATNRPGDLDDAVCRRLPHMLHVPMPRLADRRAILDIYLRDEKVADDVDLQQLAVTTDGFSGSDLRTLCVQAAMAAQRDIEAAAERKRVLEKPGQQGEQAGDDEKTVELPGDGEEKSGGDAKKEEKKEEKEEEELPLRVIGNAHFRKALGRTRPSVTRESLMTIERFIRGQKSDY